MSSWVATSSAVPKLEVAAHVRVNAFGVLADDGEVDVVRRGVLQRAKGCVEQPDRTHVRVEVHLEAHAQQDFLGVDISRHARIAERTHEDGVEVAGQHLKAVRRNSNAIDQIPVGAPVKVGELDGRTTSADDFDGVGDNFLANAVSGNDCDAFLEHGRRRYHSLWLIGEAGELHHAANSPVPVFGVANLDPEQDQVRIHKSFGKPPLVASTP